MGHDTNPDSPVFLILLYDILYVTVANGNALYMAKFGSTVDKLYTALCFSIRGRIRERVHVSITCSFNGYQSSMRPSTAIHF